MATNTCSISADYLSTAFRKQIKSAGLGCGQLTGNYYAVYYVLSQLCGYMFLCPLPYSCRQSLSNLDRVSMAKYTPPNTVDYLSSTEQVLQPHSQPQEIWPAMATSVSPNTTYMDVMSQQLHHLIPTVSIRLVLIMLQLLRTAFLLVQATVCCRLYNRSQAAEVV